MLAVARLRPLLEGARSAWAPVLLTLAANLPGRLALGAREAEYGRPGWQFVVGGLVADVATWTAPLVALVIASRASGAWLEHKGARRLGGTLPTGLLAVVAVAMWILSVGTTEHKIQRGLYPTYFEIKMGLSDATFVLGSLPIFLMRRYLWPSLVGLPVVGLCVAALRRTGRGPAVPTRLLGLALGTGAVLATSGLALVLSGRLFPAVDHRRELYPAAVTIYKGLRAQKRTAIFRGLRGVFSTAPFSAEQVQRGAAILGYSPAHATRLGEPPVCDRHPLSRPLPAEEPSPPPLVSGLLELSRLLFSGDSAAGELVVWQVAIESFRGDDVAALNPAALPEITPVTNAAYADASGPTPHTLAFRHAYQGGIRTSQAVSGLLCGLGGMPFNLAVSRDLGYAPFRCLPDLLADAGFVTHAYHGSHLSFDNLLEFLRYHGVGTTENVDLPKGLPTAVWGSVSDDPIYAYALDRLQRTGGAQYNFILTLAGHTPFNRPSDMPADVAARLDAALRRRNAALDEDDRKRLMTLAYGDWALGRLIDAVDHSAQASRSIVVVSADHATGDHALWSAPSPRAFASIPLFIHLPPALLARARDRVAAEHELAALQRLVASSPVSANDLPTLLVALLSATPRLQQLPAGQRWHTFGGQLSSPFFRLPDRPQARSWGITAGAQLFGASAEGEAFSLDERVDGFDEPQQIPRLGPVLRPVAALLSSFLASYASKCPGPENIRRLR